MATFTDDLTLVLDLLVLVSAALFYTAVFVWFNARRGDLDRARSHLREGATVLGVLGGLIGIIAIWGEFVWPLPGAYNLFFFDSLAMLSILLLAFWVAVWFRLPTHFVGMLSVVIGSGIIYYGARAYTLSLTQEPFETLLLYLGFGAVAILAYPVTLFIDWFIVGPVKPEVQPIASNGPPEYPRLWLLLLGLFVAMVVLAGIAALLYGFSTAWTHLESPP